MFSMLTAIAICTCNSQKIQLLALTSRYMVGYHEKAY